MANTWGHSIRLSIFGESHGVAIGIVIDGLPAGKTIDLHAVERQMARRMPGQSKLTTARKEPDKVEIVSGLYENTTTGSPLCGIIYNQDARSRDYNSKLRPGHADWTAFEKFKGHADMRGGGHFSGRLTAPLVFAGAIAQQLLKEHEIVVYGRIASIGAVHDEEVPVQPGIRSDITNRGFPVSGEAIEEQMKQVVWEAKKECDSVGGTIEVVAFNVPAGLGEPFFASVESKAASLFFSVPAVKGVEFGDGFALTEKYGSETNDALYIKDGSITAKTNHNGGILGGITNGLPVIAKVAVKPTASIAKPQHTVDTATMEETILEVHGRHDPCIVPRAVPVVEAALALCLLDCLLERGFER